MKRKGILFTALFALAATPVLLAQTTPSQPQSQTPHGDRTTGSQSSHAGSNDLTGSDREFVMKAAEGGKKEVHMGNMAKQRASNSQVKEFAAMIVSDHSKANQELMSLAKRKGWNVGDSAPMSGSHPTTSATGSDTGTMRGKTRTESDHQNRSATGVYEGTGTSSSLDKLKGAEFDREYMKEMVNDHEQDLALFERASKECADMDLRSFAEKTAPTIRQHLDRARTISQSLGTTNSSSNR